MDASETPAWAVLAIERSRRIEWAFVAILHAALAGERAPKNISLDIEDGVVDPLDVVSLCKTGRIKIEISGRNYRQITILSGPHAGKSTAPNPNGSRVWKTVTRDGTQITRRVRVISTRVRRQPSPPALLPHLPYRGKAR